MQVKTEQFKFDLGTIAQNIAKHTEEVFQHLLDTGKNLEGITIINDDDRKLEIISLNPDCSLTVKDYDEIEKEGAYEMSLNSMDAYQMLDLLSYIKFNILKQG